MHQAHRDLSISGTPGSQLSKPQKRHSDNVKKCELGTFIECTSHVRGVCKESIQDDEKHQFCAYHCAFFHFLRVRRRECQKWKDLDVPGTFLLTDLKNIH